MFGNWKSWFGEAPIETGVNLANLNSVALEYSKDELARATNTFSQSQVLGAGNYGAVYKGVMRDGSEVAIKRLEVEENSSSDSGFLDEVKVLSKFRHPNLVTLMGWGRDKGVRFIVYELLAGGDVSNRLKNVARGEPFDWTERLSIALDAAQGLSHMHNSTPKAFHRDIKSANILLDRNGTAKMADFGLSLINKRPKDRPDMTVVNISGTPGYACPHYIRTGRITEQTEVFAFGMVNLELLMNCAPACMGQNGAILYPIFQTIMPQVPGTRERALQSLDSEAHWPPEIAAALVDISLECIHIEETKRLDFIRVLHKLRPIRDQNLGDGRRRPHAAQNGYGGSTPHGRNTTPRSKAHPSSSSSAPPIGAGYDEPTRPQLGLGCSPPVQGHPTAHLPFGPPVEGSSADTTRPQLPAPGMSVPPTTGPSHIGYDARTACPKTAVRPQGMAPLNLAEVVLECTYAAGLDVSSIPDKHRCHTLKRGELGPPWSVGRQQQPNFFARLVKDEALRSCISRSHLELIWEAPRLLLKKLSPNTLLLNGQAVPPTPVALGHGAQLGFCPAIGGEGSGTPFLIFTVQIRDAATVAQIGPTALPTKPDLPIVPVPEHGASEMKLRQQQQQQQHQQQMLQQQQSQQQAYQRQQQSFQPQQAPMHVASPPPQTKPQRAFLTCYMALAPGGGERNLESISHEMRSIAVPVDGQLIVGRTCQQGFFEGLLGTESQFLTFISRQHFEVVSLPNDPGAFEVTNLSGNPLVVNAQLIEKGRSCQMRLPGGIDFISKASGPDSQVFLRLRASEAHAHRDSQSNSSIAPSAAEIGKVQIPVAVKASAVPASQFSVPVSQSNVAGNGVRDGPFWLDLGGNACKGSFLTTARSRRIIGTEAGLSVGRNHQAQFLSEALKDGVLQFVSREHFKIEPARGQFQLVPLSVNPMWRVRSGERVAASKGCQPLLLEPGDSILLSTGASDNTPDGPGSQGLLVFHFGDPWMARPHESVSRGTTPQLQNPSENYELRAAIGNLDARLSHSDSERPMSLRPQPPATLRAQASSTPIMEPGTGLFNADGTPVTPSYQGALRPPIPGLNCVQEDELLDAKNFDIGSYDFGGGQHSADTFSASGFSYNR